MPVEKSVSNKYTGCHITFKISKLLCLTNISLNQFKKNNDNTYFDVTHISIWSSKNFEGKILLERPKLI